jgi:5'-3' exonuclease
VFDNLEKVTTAKRILIIDGTNNLIRAVSVA